MWYFFMCINYKSEWCFVFDRIITFYCSSDFFCSIFQLLVKATCLVSSDLQRKWHLIPKLEKCKVEFGTIVLVFFCLGKIPSPSASLQQHYYLYFPPPPFFTTPILNLLTVLHKYNCGLWLLLSLTHAQANINKLLYSFKKVAFPTISPFASPHRIAGRQLSCQITMKYIRIHPHILHSGTHQCQCGE